MRRDPRRGSLDELRPRGPRRRDHAIEERHDRVGLARGVVGEPTASLIPAWSYGSEEHRRARVLAERGGHVARALDPARRAGLGDEHELGVARIGVVDRRRLRPGVVGGVLRRRRERVVEEGFRPGSALGDPLGHVVGVGIERDRADQVARIHPEGLDVGRVGRDQGDEVGPGRMADQEDPGRVAAVREALASIQATASPTSWGWSGKRTRSGRIGGVDRIGREAVVDAGEYVAGAGEQRDLPGDLVGLVARPPAAAVDVDDDRAGVGRSRAVGRVEIELVQRSAGPASAEPSRS